MESLKEEGQFILGDRRAQIPDGGVSLPILLCDLDSDSSTGGGKLRRVVQKIIADLGDGIRVRGDAHVVLGQLQLHIEALLLRAPVEAEQGADYELVQIEIPALREV